VETELVEIDNVKLVPQTKELLKPCPLPKYWYNMTSWDLINEFAKNIVESNLCNKQIEESDTTNE
jgi:hypothetical protein